MTNNEEKTTLIQISWKMLFVQIPIIITILGYLASIEIRMSKYESALELSNRVKNIEDLMLPMLSDWKAKRELDKLKKELGLPIESSFTLSSKPPVPPTPPPPTSMPFPSKKVIKKEDVTKIEKDAGHWAQSQLPNVSQNSIQAK